MKLSEHIDYIRQQIDSAFRNRLGRMGISDKGINNAMILEEYLKERDRINEIFQVLVSETGSVNDGYEKLVEEFTFTLFNRLAALKVMEAHTLHPEISVQTNCSAQFLTEFQSFFFLVDHPLHFVDHHSTDLTQQNTVDPLFARLFHK